MRRKKQILAGGIAAVLLGAFALTGMGAASTEMEKASDDIPTMPAAAYAPVFSDVPSGAWYEEAVNWCRDNGIMDGTDNNAFLPDTTMSRAMLATVLYRVEGSPAVNTTVEFSDVAEGIYYKDAVAWSSENEIMSGYGNGLFGSNDPVTREQLARGQYTPFRVLQIVLVILALLSMLGSMVSGIVLSRHALTFLPITGGQSWARTLHMLSAYWGFVIMSLHLGLHWNIMLAMAGKTEKKSSVLRTWALRIAGCLIAAYGAYAFVQRGVGRYMTLQDQFVFFDFSEPLILFLLDYMAIMGLFVFIGHYLAKALSHQQCL